MIRFHILKVKAETGATERRRVAVTKTSEEDHDREKVKNRKNSKSNGIGIYNVLERLQMYYTTEDVLEIKSDGEGKGTRFTLKIPKEVRP